MKYLYGAAVQGIQSFIFQTNELKEIVGASELVENICTELFAMTIGKTDLANDENAVMNAAGNIKYIFENEDECMNVVRIFPKNVIEYAPGITISQAVEKLAGDDDFERAVMELEKKLRAQRNHQMNSTTIGLMGIKRSNQTNLPVEHIIGKELTDRATYKKRKASGKGSALSTKKLCSKSFGIDEKELKWEKLAMDTTDLTEKNDWIAVIHIDGNGLGQVVQKVGKNKDDFKEFSHLLYEATSLSAAKAFQGVYKYEENINVKIPFRPVVLSGDDHTIICRGDLAILYVKAFLSNFEEYTKTLEHILKKYEVFTKGDNNHLTACAGIAFIKSSYPFYFAYELAEVLCAQAKNDAKDSQEIREGKELPQSCLMFHKVQDSFIESWRDIVDRELRISETETFEFGPYYIKSKPNRWTIDTLVGFADKLNKDNGNHEGNAAKTGVRSWLSLMSSNESGKAIQKLKRLKEITSDNEMKALIEKLTTSVPHEAKNNKTTNAYPAYDVIALHTINNQQTRN